MRTNRRARSNSEEDGGEEQDLRVQIVEVESSARMIPVIHLTWQQMRARHEMRRALWRQALSLRALTLSLHAQM